VLAVYLRQKEDVRACWRTLAEGTAFLSVFQHVAEQTNLVSKSAQWPYEPYCSKL